jgi:hypothetical protein
VVTGPNAIGNTHQCTPVHVSVLRLIADSQNADPAPQIVKISLAPLIERLLNRMPLGNGQFAALDETVECLLNELLQIAGSQVEKDLAVVKSLLQANPDGGPRGSPICRSMGSDFFRVLDAFVPRRRFTAASQAHDAPIQRRTTCMSVSVPHAKPSIGMRSSCP